MATGKDGRFYDPVFDLNRDGILDSGEYAYYQDVLFGDDKPDDGEDDDLFMDDLNKSELEEAGIDISEFKFLDDNEKYAALMQADLDPEDYEDLFDDYDEAKVVWETKESREVVREKRKSLRFLRDKEKLRKIWEEDLDPEDYEDQFDDYSKVSKLIEYKDDLDCAGIEILELMSLNDREKVFELLEEDLDPDDFEDLFDSYYDIEHIVKLAEELDYNDVSWSDFTHMSDTEKLRAIWDADCDTDDYRDLFSNYSGIADIIVLKEELDACGIDWDDFSDSGDSDKLEQLWDEELDPERFSFFFDDYSSVNPAIQLKQELDFVGIEMDYFLEIEDQKKRRLIEKLGLDVNEYSYLFDDISETPTDEAEANESESKNYYLEEEIFKAKGIPEESLRFADEVTRRLVLQRAGLQYEDFKGYFVEFDLAQKWMNRTDNDLTMLQEILKTLEENPDMLKRGITEWTDGKIKVIARKKETE